MTQFSYSSCNKEHDGIYVLQIGISMAKLQPLVSHCKYFMKSVFCNKFLLLYTEDFWMCHYVRFSQIESPLLKAINIYVAGYWKTTQIVTLGLFHFIGPANRYTLVLPIHSANTRLSWWCAFLEWVMPTM